MGREGFGYENEKGMMVLADGPGLCTLLDTSVAFHAV